VNPHIAPRPGPDAAAACTRLIGRGDERARVEAFLESAAFGPATLVVRGEAGIGRSTMWQYALGAAGERGFAVYAVRAIRPRDGDSVRPVAGLDDLFGPDPDGDAAQRLPAFDRGRRVLDVLRRLSADAPVLLGVDDPQWLDAESANALRFAFDRLTGVPVGAIVTASGADEVVVVDGRHAERLELGPLPMDALRHVLARSLPAVSRPDLVRAHELSNGNPTAALQLIRSWLRERQGGPAVSDDPGPAPEIRDLPADAIAVVRALAVAGSSPVGVVDGYWVV
jgi:hypothetical protein